MRFKILVLGMALFATPVLGEGVLEDFSRNPDARWAYFADTVMGGLSSGGVEFKNDAEGSFARLTGTVSTENNGGFIQIRSRFSAAPPEDTQGIRLTVRGNNQPYYIHLRTRGTRLPWQYYQAEFAATGAWTEVKIPFSEFKPSGGLLRKTLRPSSLRTLGVVAYGRDHLAEVDVSEIAFY